ncbi:type II secretion system protein GspG [Methylobacterium sp. J-030]|uniref:type II secretion system protein GspG n=1 Tax=Methylobacterium sp. J-030 TaxID=2836627 RepID=UPI001FB9C7DE|nr:type II secretion system protein GspG [Methylobacterium sp. J-030]MCJ2070452.1 type II secretion system protein GspG [Methylobacterium sp. J-030]
MSAREPCGEAGFTVVEVLVAFAVAALGILLALQIAGETTRGLTAPWGRPYLYRSPGSQGPYEVYSLGSDGQVGGTGDAADKASP